MVYAAVIDEAFKAGQKQKADGLFGILSLFNSLSLLPHCTRFAHCCSLCKEFIAFNLLDSTIFTAPCYTEFLRILQNNLLKMQAA